jgi:subtilisin family serine protease
MKRIALLFASALLSIAQIVPNRYIVEFSTEPAASVAIAKKSRFSMADGEIRTRQLEIRREHAVAEAAIGSLGGQVTHHFDTVLNGMAVTMSPEQAARVRQMPNVTRVSPVLKFKMHLDHAVNVHQISQAWKSLSNGRDGAGAGVKIAIFDSGIDITHPAFQGFATKVPDGFPKGTNNAELANTNNKVIVSRFYSDVQGQVTNTTGVACAAADSIQDCGHGTSVAMVAAGLSNDPQLPGVSPLVGVAPGAWLGNYKVHDDYGDVSFVNLLSALDDAVKDGMDVINYSAGGFIADSSEETTGPLPAAIQKTLDAGVLFVASAGNDGSVISLDSNGAPVLSRAATTMSTPAAVPAAIAVGANQNERFFYNAVTLAGMSPTLAILPTSQFGVVTGTVSGPVTDVAKIDGNGYGCNAFPANSLSNQIALIQRGPKDGTPCAFDTKLANAQNAGAVGAIVYNHTDGPILDFTWDAEFIYGGFGMLIDPSISSSLPMMFVSLGDGQALKSAVAANPGIQGVLDLDGQTPVPLPSNSLVDFSSIGPTPGGSVKPDLVAVGDSLLTADAVANNPGFPYFLGGGTSFSAPLVTGAVALLKSARPGLTAAQYKSLIVNSSAEFDSFVDGKVIAPQLGGAGMLNSVNSLANNIAASPTSLNFAVPKSSGSGSSSSSPAARDDQAAASTVSQTITLTNVGSASDSFTISVQAIGNGPAPTLDSSSFNLGAGASQAVKVSLDTTKLQPGQYQGFLLVTGTKSSVATRVPYWYAVAGSQSAAVQLLNYPQFSSTGNAETIYFRVTDAAGLPFEPAADPTVTSSNARARVTDVIPIGDVPGTFQADVVIGRADPSGVNTFTITADGVTYKVIVFVQ